MLEVRFGEPEELDWFLGMTIQFDLVYPQAGTPIRKICYLADTPPPDAKMELILQTARLESGTEEDSRTVYVFQTLVDPRLSRTKTLPVALYQGGELQEYCRPPWRRGACLS